MRKATIPLCVLVLLSTLAFAGFVVTPTTDSFDVLQNASSVRTYIVQNNDTSGIIDLSTSASWAYDTTDFVNASPGNSYNTKVTFSPLMMPPGVYSVIITFASRNEAKTVKAQVKVVKTSWLYAYLLPNESYTGITYENVSLGNDTYSLVLIKGADSFLVKNSNQIVKDVSEIRRFYEEYYSEKFYPSQAELDDVSALAKVFDDSRNAHSTYNLPAESSCLMYTGLSSKDCYDRTSCTLTCGIVSIDNPARCGDSILIQNILAFSADTKSIRGNLSDFRGAMAGIGRSNISQSLDKAKAALQNIKPPATAELDSKLRQPDVISTCMDCYGMCPKMVYNITALDQAISKLGALQLKASPIRNLDTKPNDLLFATNKRLSDVLGKEHKEGYATRYETVKPLADELAKAVAEAKANVKSPELDEKYSEFTNATASLEWAIASGDYSNITKLDKFFDTNMDTFYKTKSEVERILSETNGIYEKAYVAKQNASDYIIKAGMNVQPGDPAALELKIIQGRMADADANFTKPLLADSADPLFLAYSGIAKDAKEIAETKPSSSILGRMVSKIVRTEKWIALSLMGAIKPMTLPEKTVVAEYVAPVTAGLIAMGLAGVLLLFLVIFALRNRKRLGRVRSQIALYSFFSAMTMIVALICLGMFYYLTMVYAGESTLNLFISEIHKAGGAAVFVDESSASGSPDPATIKTTMAECGERIAASLQKYRAKIYYVDGSACRAGGQSFNYTDCDREFSQLPVIYVRYGSANAVSFRTLYAMNASYTGNDGWLKDCYLAGALR